MATASWGFPGPASPSQTSRARQIEHENSIDVTRAGISGHRAESDAAPKSDLTPVDEELRQAGTALRIHSMTAF